MLLVHVILANVLARVLPLETALPVHSVLRPLPLVLPPVASEVFTVAFNPPVSKVSCVDIPIWPGVPTVPVLFASQELACVLASVGEGLCPQAMRQIVLELTCVFLRPVKVESSLALHLALVELAGVEVSVSKGQEAFSVHLSELKVPLVQSAL